MMNLGSLSNERPLISSTIQDTKTLNSAKPKPNHLCIFCFSHFAKQNKKELNALSEIFINNLKL